MIQMEIGKGEEKSDITGAKIQSGEPYISINKIIYLKKNELEKTKEIFLEKQKGSSNIRIQKIDNEKCTECKNRKRVIKMNIKEDNSKDIITLFINPTIKICEDCMNDVLEEVKSTKEKIDKTVLYWNSPGMNIRKVSNIEFLDIVDDDYKQLKNSLIISLVPDTFEETILKTEASNIQKMIDYLRDVSTICTTSVKCQFCQQRVSLTMAYGITLCHGCRKEIISNLIEFEKENKEIIISNSI